MILVLKLKFLTVRKMPKYVCIFHLLHKKNYLPNEVLHKVHLCHPYYQTQIRFPNSKRCFSHDLPNYNFEHQLILC